MFEASLVSWPPLLEVAGEASVGGGGPLVLSGDGRLVDHVGSGALPGHRAGGSVSAVAVRGSVLIWLLDFDVVFRDVWLDVWKTAITYFHCVPVAKLVKGMVLVKSGFHNLQIFLPNVCFDITAPGWIEPDDFSFSSSFLRRFMMLVWSLWVEFQLKIVTTFFDCSLVGGCCSVKDTFIDGDLTQPVVDILWEILCNRWRVIW